MALTQKGVNPLSGTMINLVTRGKVLRSPCLQHRYIRCAQSILTGVETARVKRTSRGRIYGARDVPF